MTSRLATETVELYKTEIATCIADARMHGTNFRDSVDGAVKRAIALAVLPYNEAGETNQATLTQLYTLFLQDKPLINKDKNTTLQPIDAGGRMKLAVRLKAFATQIFPDIIVFNKETGTFRKRKGEAPTKDRAGNDLLPLSTRIQAVLDGAVTLWDYEAPTKAKEEKTIFQHVDDAITRFSNRLEKLEALNPEWEEVIKKMNETLKAMMRLEEEEKKESFTAGELQQALEKQRKKGNTVKVQRNVAADKIVGEQVTIAKARSKAQRKSA